MKGAFGKRRRPSLSLGYGWPERGFLAKDWDCAVLDKLIGPADAHDWRIDHLRVQMFHDGAAKTVVQNMIFDRADHFHAAREKFEGAGVHRLYPTRIDERNGNSFFFQLARRFFGNFKHVAEAEDRHIAPVLHDFGLTDLQKFGFRFDFHTRTGAARITDGDWTGIIVGHCPEHVDKLIIVLQLHVHPVRHVSQVTDVEQAVM